MWSRLQILRILVCTLAFVALSTVSAQLPAEDQSPAQWPYNIPPHVKYWPEDPHNHRRDIEATNASLQPEKNPVGVMKMGFDEGEKFFMEYWKFEEDLQTPLEVEEEEGASLLTNGSVDLFFRPPFLLHTDRVEERKWGTAPILRSRNAAAALAALKKRGFMCPSGTTDCSAIGYPYSCCSVSETCFHIQDTGLGPVGCCPNESTCGGLITQCDAPNTACPASLGGGCCMPSYFCAGVGCVVDPAAMVTTVITQTVTIYPSQTSTIVVTTTSITSPTSATCPPSYQTCPATLGGGCCPTDRVCASGNSCDLPSGFPTLTAPTTIATGVAPVRPTSLTATSASSSSIGTACPTGFYACEAFYAGGCCRTGRDCAKTSCPPVTSTTLVSGGLTVVVPVGSAGATARPTGACATGWESCAPTLGGNCCPSGWECGTASCSRIGATSTESSQKESPSLGIRQRIPNGWQGFAAAATLLAGLITF